MPTGVKNRANVCKISTILQFDLLGFQTKMDSLPHEILTEILKYVVVDLRQVSELSLVSAKFAACAKLIRPPKAMRIYHDQEIFLGGLAGQKIFAMLLGGGGGGGLNRSNGGGGGAAGTLLRYEITIPLTGWLECVIGRGGQGEEFQMMSVYISEGKSF